MYSDVLSYLITRKNPPRVLLGFAVPSCRYRHIYCTAILMNLNMLETSSFVTSVNA